MFHGEYIILLVVSWWVHNIISCFMTEYIILLVVSWPFVASLSAKLRAEELFEWSFLASDENFYQHGTKEENHHAQQTEH